MRVLTTSSGTFFARDNLSNFIQWARSLGVDQAVIFEADDLVQNKSEKNVLYRFANIRCTDQQLTNGDQSDGNCTCAAWN